MLHLVIPSAVKSKGRTVSAGNGWCNASCSFAPLAVFMIRSLSPPGIIPSCSAVDSREGGDILRHIPPRLCSLHSIFFFFFIYSPHSYVVKWHHASWLQSRTHAVQGLWCTIILIPLKRRCVRLSDHIKTRVRSHTLVTLGSAASLIPVGCRHQRWPSATAALTSHGNLCDM